MNVDELKELLAELATEDLDEGHDINDHPCSVAIRAIDKYAEDIKLLRGVISGRELHNSKRATILIKMGPSTSF